MATLLNKEILVNNRGGTKNAYKFKSEVIENSTSISNNTSNVTINYYAAHNLSSTGGYKQFNTPKAVISVDNSEKANVTVAQIYGTTYAKIATWTGDILHNSDGTKSIVVKIAYDPKITSGYTYVPIANSIEETLTLTTIPRTSSFSANDAKIEGICNITINRAAAFTHTLLYSFGNLSGTIATGIATSYTWNVPSSFYNQIPNSSSGTCTITCITYNGSTEIGRSSKTITISCNEAKCKPNISGTITDINQTTINLSGDENKLIKNKSTARVTPTASAKNGATIKSITVDGMAVSTYQDFTNVSKNSFTLVCTDSRGFNNSITISADMIDYVTLSLNASFKRKTQTSGEVDLVYSGNYFNGSFSSENNSLTINWKYREKGSTEWIDGGELTPELNGNTFNGNIVCGDNFNYQKVYEFIVYYSDKLESLSTGILVVTKGIPNFAIFKNCIKLNGVKIH